LFGQGHPFFRRGGKQALTDVRIASFLPAATEMVCALGLADKLIGVSHECDYPPEAKGKPVVVRCVLDLASLSLEEVDRAVSRQLGEGKSLYAVDEKVLQALSPTLIVTQDLCQVCAPSGNEAVQVFKTLVPKPEILWQTPHSFEDVLNDLLSLGEKTGTRDKALELTGKMRKKVETVASLTAKMEPLRVFFMEWADPVYCGGHWIPEMLKWAGGKDSISKPGADSIRIPWDDVVQLDPEVLVIAPCGFKAQAAWDQAETLKSKPGWSRLAAVQKGRVFAVDANSYFARPGPRLAEGVELLAHLLHPELFQWNGPADAFKAVQ
jgi:iron complex transport system substrate-binding protein